jgi:hypothetical protein
MVMNYQIPYFEQLIKKMRGSASQKILKIFKSRWPEN